MTGTAAEQLRRILHLIPYLADGETHAYDDVAARAGVDRSVLMGDIESISERFEAPGGFVEGLQIYVGSDGLSVVPNHFLRPMRLTRGELLALELGLAMIRTERPLEERHAIDGARERLRKVIALLPDEQIGDGARVASLSHGGNLEYLRRLRVAFRQRHKVRLSYRKATDASAASRVICPYGIAFASGMWYVIAGNEGGEGIRIFRLDRIENVDVLEMGFERPHDFSVDAVVRDGRAFQGGEAAPLKVRYSARIARWIAEREGLEPADDGSLTVEHPLADTDWAVRHILQYGPDAEVLAPAEVKAELARRLAAMDARG